MPIARGIWNIAPALPRIHKRAQLASKLILAFVQAGDMSALNMLFHCVAIDLHNNYYNGIYQRYYEFDKAVFQFLRGRIQFIRSLYFQMLFSSPALNVSHSECLLTDHLFFNQEDPICLLEQESLYLAWLTRHLEGLASVNAAQQEIRRVFTGKTK